MDKTSKTAKKSAKKADSDAEGADDATKSENKLEIDDYFDIIMLWYHEVLMIKASNDVNSLVLKDRYYELKRVAGEISFQGIQNVLEAIEKARTRIRANVNLEIVMDLLFFAMKEN